VQLSIQEFSEWSVVAQRRCTNVGQERAETVLEEEPRVVGDGLLPGLRDSPKPFFFFLTLVTDPRRSLRLALSDSLNPGPLNPTPTHP